MAKSTANEPLSADSMIEDLLSKKETFRKRKENSRPQGISAWLIPGSGAVHPVYERIWIGVQKGNFAHTPVFSRLLMTSGLSTDSLGFIWSLANQTVAGTLTQQEVYIVLALVALAQTGYIVSNIAALNHFPQPPLPKLDLSILPITQNDIPLLPYTNTSTGLLLSNISNTLTPKIVTPLCAVNLLDTQTNTSTIAQSHLVQNTVGTPSVLWDIPKQEIVSVQNNEKIGISYVSRGGLSLQDSVVSVTSNFESGIIPQKSNSFSGMFPHFSASNINKPHDILQAQSRQPDTEILSESCTNLRLDKSQNLSETNLSCSNCDDEFTDFQSAYTLSEQAENYERSDETVKNALANVCEKSEVHRNINTDEDDEFTGFQNALPFPQNNCNEQIKPLNVLRVSNVHHDKENKIFTEPYLQYNNDQNVNSENCRKSKINSSHESEINHIPGKSDLLGSCENTLDKYQAFQEVFESSGCEIKCSVFHNPLPEIISDSEELTQTEDNSSDFFQTSFFCEPSDNSNLPLDLPKIGKSVTVENVTVEDHNMFGVSKCETKTPQNYDKYDAFKTLVLELSNSDKNNTHLSYRESSNLETVIQEEEEYTDFQSSQVTFVTSQEPIQYEGDIFELPFKESKSCVGNNFVDFQTSESVTRNVNQTASVQTTMAPDKMSLCEQMLTQTSDSLKSLVLNSAVEDKYSALRILEPASDADEFGDFLGADTQLTLPSTSKSTAESIQVRCLEACLHLLQAGHSILNSASSPEVLSEVLSDPRATTYLDCLLEVQRVSKRIINNIEHENIDRLKNNIEKAWKELSPFYEYSEHVPIPESTGAVCSLCQSDTGPSPLKYGLCTFHAPCANLYMHCVDPVLPNVTAVK